MVTAAPPHRRARIMIAAAAVSLGSLAVAAPTDAGHGPGPTGRIDAPEALSSTTVAGYRANITSITNSYRRSNGRANLMTSSALTNACQVHANDMVRMGRITHTGSDGSDPGTRARRAGFPWTTYGENVAAGQRSSRQVVDAWMASSGHRANILNGRFTRIGIGVQSSSSGVIYYCMLLARP